MTDIDTELLDDSRELGNNPRGRRYSPEMPVNIFVVESELPESETSVKDTWEVERDMMKQAGQLGKHEFIAGQSSEELDAAMERFAEWTRDIPCDEPVLLWLSVHGRTPKAKGHVGTSGVTARKQLIEWFKFFNPAKNSTCPSRIVLLMDVCWGGSPTAPSRLTTPKASRPHMVFGPRRAAYRNELDSAFEEVVGIVKTGALPTEDDAKTIVDKLNQKYPPVNDGEFYVGWWWDATGLKRHPAITKNAVNGTR